MPLLFFLKKLITACFFPLTWCWVGLLVGVIWAVRRRSKWGALGLGLPLAVLWVGANGPLADALLTRLEDAYPPLVVDEVTCEPEWIVVLGGGSFNPELPGGVTTQAQDVFWMRLSEGARLAQAFPEAELLISASGTPPSPDLDAFLVGYAELFGIEVKRIVALHGARDTEDEARSVRERVGESPGILVTSAFHMRRALRQFRGNGVEATPAPCGYLARGRRLRLGSFFPNEEALFRMRLAIKEYLGNLRETLRR